MLNAMSERFAQPPQPLELEPALGPSRKNQILGMLGILGMAAGSFYLALVVLSRIDHILLPGNEIRLDLPGIESDSSGGRRINILVMGLDRRGGDGNAPSRTDTMFVLTVDPQTQTSRALALPRDLQVEISATGGGNIDCAVSPESTQCDRINTAYVFGELNDYPGGGIGTARRTVENLIGIEVDYHLIIDFEAFKGVIDSLGGIDVNVPEPGVNDPEYSDTELPGDYFPCVFPAGSYHMDGKQALCYARVRRNSSDLERIKRQQDVILSVVDKASWFDLMTHPMTMFDLGQQYEKTIETDISYLQTPGFALLAGELDLDKLAFQSLAEATIPYTRRRDGAQVLLASTEDVQEVVASFLADVRLDEEAAFVEVQNGNGRQGEAQRAVDLLTSLGIPKNKLQPSNAADSYQRTQIIDFTGKSYTAKKVAGRLGLSGDRVRPANDRDVNLRTGEADIVVILGSDVDLAKAAARQ
jgi:LCP family protein required for cell wall assembly